MSKNNSKSDSKNQLNENCYQENNKEENICDKTNQNQKENNQNQLQLEELQLTEKNDDVLETNFYELSTDNIVDKIQKNYNELILKRDEDINKFLQNLINENTNLKLQIKKLNIDLQTKNQKNILYQKLVSNPYFINNNTIKENTDNSKLKNILNKYEINKNEITNKYEAVIMNINNPLLQKNIEFLYNKFLITLDKLLDSQKINITLQEENAKYISKNDNIKTYILTERNNIINEIINIKQNMNSEIETNKNLLFNNNYTNERIYPSNENYLLLKQEIKYLTYEKNKLLKINHDFFSKINVISQKYTENEQNLKDLTKKIAEYEQQILILGNENQLLNTKLISKNKAIVDYEKEINNLNKKNRELTDQNESLRNNNFPERSDKDIINESKIKELNKKIQEMDEIYESTKNDYDKIKQQYESQIASINVIKNDKEKIFKEKNQLATELEKYQGKCNLLEKELLSIKNELENKNKELSNYININKNDYAEMQKLINDIYNYFIKNNIFNSGNENENADNNSILPKLKIIKNNLKILLKINENRINSLLTENEIIKSNIKEIIELTLENTNEKLVKKIRDNSANINLEILLLKIIDYIKVIKICSLLQKKQTIVNYSDKYLNFIFGTDFDKKNNLDYISNTISTTQNDIIEIKNLVKKNSLDLEKQFTEFLSKDEVKNEFINIKEKYENIISGLFEYFLKYKVYGDNEEFLLIQIPIKNYNLMIESNMKNICAVSQSIESWNLFVNNEINDNNNNVFKNIIELTRINGSLKLNNFGSMLNNEEGTCKVNGE